MTSTSDNDSKFLEDRRNMFSLANTHAIIDAIRLGECITDEKLAEHITFFKEKLDGLVKRLPKNYSVYRLFSHKVGAKWF